MILSPAITEKAAALKIHRLPNGTVLGCCLWIPGSFIEPRVQSGQEEIEVAFEGDFIKIGNATGVGKRQ